MDFSQFSEAEVACCAEALKMLIDTLKEFADELDKHKLNANVSKAVGGGVATLGSVLTIGGFVASFLSFGAASFLIPVGVAVGALGGGTVAGTAVVELVIKKKKIEEAQKLWDNIFKDPVFNNCLKQLEDPNERDQVSIIATGAARGVKTGALIGGAVAKTSLEAAQISARALVIAGAALEAVILPLNLYDLINSSIEIHKKRKCPAGDELRKVAKLFERIHVQMTKKSDT